MSNLTQNAIPRGIQAVRAEANIGQVIGELNTAFADFRNKNDSRLDAIERQMETDATVAAARQMGNFASTKPASKFQAHYSQKPDYQASNEPVTTADFLRGVAGLKTSPAVRAALSEGTGTAGGYSTPSKLMPSILDTMVAQSAVLNAGAQVQLVDAKTVTLCATDAVPAAGWRAESANVLESDPSFRAIISAPKSLSFYFKVSRELLMDALGLDLALTTAISQSMALAIDRAALIGSGVGVEPLGIAGTAGVHQIASGANGATLSGYGKLFEATQAILGASHPMPTGLICSPRELVKLGAMVDTTGQPLQTPAMLAGVNRYATAQLPVNGTTGTSSDTSQMFLGTFNNLALVLREQLFIGRFEQTFATTGEIGFVCHCRADIAVLRPQAFAVVSGVRA